MNDLRNTRSLHQSASSREQLRVSCQSDAHAQRKICKIVDKGLAWNDWYQGYTPLGRAAAAGRADVVRIFLLQGADVNLTNEYGVWHVD